MTRPLLAFCVRDQMRLFAGVEIRDNVTVRSYVPDRAGAGVTGVRPEDSSEISVDLVVDCSGRRSAFRNGLCPQAFPPPPERRIGVDVVYATCLMRPDHALNCPAVAQIAPAGEKRSGVTFAVENCL